MTLTAETITDAQIRALRDRYAGTGDGDKHHHALIALGERRAARGETRQMSRARCAALLNARSTRAKEPLCDFRDSHDLATDQPTGNGCSARATHRIEWADGRYSLGCGAHLEIDDSASVKPIRIVPLILDTNACAKCRGREHPHHATVTCNGTCCTACGGPIDENEECRC